MQENKIDLDSVALRVMLRQFAPHLSGVFESAAQQSGEPKYNFQLLIGYDHKGDLENQNNVKMVMKSRVTNLQAVIKNDTSATDKDNADLLKQIFPIASQLLCSQAADWNIDPFNILMHLRVKEVEGKKDTMELKLMEKNQRSVPGFIRREKILD